MSTRRQEVSRSIPVRRTRWVSFWVGLAAVILAALSAAASVAALVLGLLAWSGAELDGFWAVFLFGLLWFGLFFLSYPLQRRYSRSRDARRPGITLAGSLLTVPVASDSALQFNFDEPHELVFGWCEHVMTSAGGPTTLTRGVWTHALLSQAGRQLYLIAEDSVREAQAAGWPKTPIAAATTAMPRVNLWASDLVALVEVARARPSAVVKPG